MSGASKSSEMKPTLLKYCKQISMGLSYLKGKEIVHGAVKAENILVTAEDICKVNKLMRNFSTRVSACRKGNGSSFFVSHREIMWAWHYSIYILV